MAKPGKRSLFRGPLKWSLLLSLGFTLICVCLLQRAAAGLGDQALRLGPELASWAGRFGPVTTLELNGHTMHVGSVTSEQTVAQVLTRFRALCTRESGGLAEELSARARPLIQDDAQLALGITREALGDGVGASGCFARGKRGGSLDLLRRIREFAASRDLSALGQLRYVYVRKTDSGGSHAVLVWNDGPLLVQRMFPALGDAAGGDLPGVPRPGGSRRLISAQVRGKPYGLLTYELAERDPLVALERYHAQLTAAGFRAVHLPTVSEGELYSRVFLQDDVPLQVHAVRNGPQTVIALLRMGGRSHATYTAER
jgi:hypothetical protein